MTKKAKKKKTIKKRNPVKLTASEVKVNTDTMFAKLLFDLELEIQRHEQTTTAICGKLNLISVNPDMKDSDKAGKGTDFVTNFRALMSRFSNANSGSQDNLQHLNQII